LIDWLQLVLWKTEIEYFFLSLNWLKQGAKAVMQIPEFLENKSLITDFPETCQVND